jgi:ribonuclease BN (tRNA processing enzyme)
MKLVVLGSGTSVPHARRAASAFWLETASGTILLDAGADAAHRLAVENLPWAQLDAIWISHFHLDHIGGLAPFLFGTKYAPQTQSRRKPLTITGPRGLRRVIENFDAAYDYGLLKQPFPVEVREVAAEEEFEVLPRITATTLSTPHTDESLALRLAGERTFVYTADTGRHEPLASFARDADFLVTEASFRHTSPVATHLTLAEALDLATGSNVRRTMLTHFYPEWDTFDVEEEARALSNIIVLEARDGRQVDVNDATAN